MDDKDHITSKRESSERTSVLANERTYAAWLRTGLTALAAGLGIEKFLGDGSVIPINLIRIVSISLLSLSTACFYLAAWRYQHVGVRLVSSHVSGAPVWLLVLISGILCCVTLITLVGLWF
ncbi:MAG: DUF202 domain-containing protein [Chlamydiota bacterium]|nr:DUF202 domain-containing protein [Chlamydiota bacterium]